MTKLHAKALASALAFFVALFTGSWTRVLLRAAPAGVAAPQTTQANTMPRSTEPRSGLRGSPVLLGFLWTT